MARPKKISESPVVEPNLNLEEPSDVRNETEAPLVIEANESAFSFYKVTSPEGKVLRWEVTKIMFNPDTGTTKSPEIILACDSEAEALNTFKKTVAQTILQRNR